MALATRRFTGSRANALWCSAKTLSSTASAAIAGQPENRRSAANRIAYHQAVVARAATKTAPPAHTKRRSKRPVIDKYYRHVMRVVVSGIGVVSPFGVGRERFWQHVSRGCSGTRAIVDFDASEFPCRVAAPLGDVTINDLPAIAGDEVRDPEHRADPKRYSRAALAGVIAAREAWNDAGLAAGEAG